MPVMQRFKVANDNDSDIDDGYTVEAASARMAVEKCVEEHHADWDYASEMRVRARLAHGGRVEVFDVTVEAIPTAWAKPAEV